MPEEQNIPDGETSVNKPQATEEDSQAVTDAGLLTTNQKLQTEAMEVHKHPHHVTHKKKWPEYLLEFFMLFLAVFLGFVAENIREGVVENHREKQFMQSLIKDLQLDTAYVNLSLSAISKRDLSLDSTLNYFVDHPNAVKVPVSTVRQMRRSTWDQVFLEHAGTIDQLNYSGGLRLIHKRNLVDSI